MGVPKAMHGNRRNTGSGAPPRQHAVHCGVVHFAAYENGTVFGKPLHQLRELDYELPIDRHLPNRRPVLRRQEPRSLFIVPGLIDREDLVGEVEILRSDGKGLRKPQPRLRDKENPPVPIEPRS